MKFTRLTNSANRRKAIYLFTGALSAMMFWKFFSKPKPSVQKGKTIKMLTQDGQLVEVDERYIASRQPKLSTDEIQNWIQPKK